MDIVSALKNLLNDGERVSTNPAILEQHSKDLTYHEPHAPDVVVFPQSTIEVSQILQLAHQHRIPVVPFGMGTSLEGHVIPVRGGISLDMSRMNKMVELRPEDFLVRVQPGMTREQLNQKLKKHGLFFPVDPGADASLGGMAATNASGTNAVRYGGMKDQVLGLEVVLAGGRIIRTGSMAVKSAAGYQLTNLFIGSEGTLGVITELTLKLSAIPEAVVAARAVFDDIGQAGQAAAEMISSGLAIGRIELVDAYTIRAVNQYKQTDYTEQPTLFLEFSGRPASVEEDVQLAKEMTRHNGAKAWEEERDSLRRARLWEARHQAALAIIARSPGKKHMVTDVCVPISVLPEAIVQARSEIERHQLEAAILGHVGDGNFHVAFCFDPDHPDERNKALAVNEAVVNFALAHGGTCTGEHGIGLGKIKYLEVQYGPAVEVMAALKQTLDPRHILNPGKIIRIGM
ncbi:FAD-binding protein [Caldalkalibacillus thermarum TA2.A1]|uniref:D-lactate dehydrogenase (cytochrome) n=1 Tax=Caldalkalibacillus thermarum (strain TA2.A1) TaxID=986075 RepID=A0A8X8I4B2_CALTT|nr:FAD-linked oxidase C-terminal domain-containing protein [Caldalkalibacillus thermarum]QZT34086.1 FAD-binding protein [Caldalkalibacillus thermarum TA2.A1]